MPNKIRNVLKLDQSLRAQQLSDVMFLGTENQNDANYHHYQNALSHYELMLELVQEKLLRTESQIDEAARRYMDIYELSPTGYFRFDELGAIINVDGGGAALLETEKSFLLHARFQSYLVEDSIVAFSQFLDKLKNAKEQQTCELQLKKTNSRDICYLRCVGTWIQSHQYHQNEYLVFVRDISLEKKDEEHIRNMKYKTQNAGYLGLLEQFTSNMVQELGQPLGVISNYANGCIRRLQTGNFAAADIIYAMNQILQVTQRAGEDYQRLKHFKCKSNFSYQLTDINVLIQNVMKLVQYELTAFAVTLHFRPGIHLPKIMLDADHIEQVILLIIRNAIEAMQADKTSNPTIVIETKLLEKNLVVTITDNGPGFLVNEDKLFDVNYTSKSFGSGLGLSICQTIIESHGGKFLALALPHGGACFTLDLLLQPPI